MGTPDELRVISQWPETSGTYFVRAFDRVKIGRAGNIRKRLYGLQTAAPTDLELLHVEPRDVEYEMHSRFSSLWVRGEWFRLEGALLSFLQDVHKNPIIIAIEHAKVTEYVARPAPKILPVRLNEQGLEERIRAAATGKMYPGRSVLERLSGHQLLKDLQEWCHGYPWDHILGEAEKILTKDGRKFEADSEHCLHICPDFIWESDDGGGFCIEYSEIAILRVIPS